MKVLYRGNFQPGLPDGIEPWSTESEIAKALHALGHTVIRCQEDQVGWPETLEMARDADLFLWTCTYGMAHVWDQTEAHATVTALNSLLPTMAVHLDRFWGLARQTQVASEPWFRLHLVCTADGGHDIEWDRAGVNHVWMPPAVSEFECVPADPRDEYTSDVAFVGNHGTGYHPEWPHRRDLVKMLKMRYRRAVRFWPKPGHGAVRGADLRALYRSVKVVVGDSCLAPATDGSPMTRYASDRIPETIGRGALLVHPYVEGVTDGTLYTPDVHLATWSLGDWDGLFDTVDAYLDDDEMREEVAEAGRAHVLEHHTYTVRMRQLFAELEQRGLVTS